MKRLIVGIMASFLFAAPVAFANEGHDGMDMNKHVEKMKTQLSLTPDQETQVKAVLEDFKTRMQALHKEKHDKIDAILTPEQRTKHEAMMKEWKEKKKDHDDKDGDE